MENEENKILNIIEKKFEERNDTEKIDLIKFYNDLGNMNEFFHKILFSNFYLIILINIYIYYNIYMKVI